MFNHMVNDLPVAHELLLTMKQARFNLMDKEVGSILNDYEFEDMHTESADYISESFSKEDISTLQEAHVLMIPASGEHCAQYGFVWRYGVDGVKNVAFFYDIVDYSDEDEEDAKDYS